MTAEASSAPAAPVSSSPEEVQGALPLVPSSSTMDGMVPTAPREQSTPVLAMTPVQPDARTLLDDGYQRSFVIGFGTDSPSHPHHRNSENIGILLTGALVGGPSQRDYAQGRGATAMQIHSAGHQDVMTDYVGNEVALDYNAGLVGLAAFGVEQQVAAAAAAGSSD